jgi:hypothetical protein
MHEGEWMERLDLDPSGAPHLDLKCDLVRPAAYAPGLAEGGVEVAETHISLVFLLDRDVFKVKKPVDLGFLDFRTLTQRKTACEAEVRLNARLAPEVYLGVVPVRRGRDGHARIGGEGSIVDWAVHMKRLPDEARADLRLARGALSPEDVDAVARALAAFHASAASDARTASFGAPEAIARNLEENFAQTRGSIERFLRPDQAEELVRWQRAFLLGHRSAFEARARAGRVRDGHGDLRLEHVYFLDGRVVILDCIEFNDRFRFADVCADLAFLSMDLAGHGRVDFAERLLATYARESGDFDLYAVVDFYESYRAYVRAKISTFVADDPAVDEAARARAAGAARRYYLLALSADRRSLLTPAVIAVGGLIASGKSTVAERVGAEASAPVVDADRTRKNMLGVASTQKIHDPAWSGAYDPKFTEAVYAEVLRRAAVVLDSGRPVVLDASFRSVEMRRLARDLAASRGVPFRFVECRTPAEVCRARLVEREARAGVSDGRLAIFDDFAARFEPVTELPPTEHVLLDTTRPLDENVAKLRDLVPLWPKGLTV